MYSYHTHSGCRYAYEQRWQRTVHRASPAPCPAAPAALACRAVACSASVHPSWLASTLAALVLTTCTPLPPHALADTPYQESLKGPQFGYNPATQSLRACQSNVNPNCVSTGSTNDLYGPAWRANETDTARAARALDSAVGELFEGKAKLLRSEAIAGMEYRAWAIDGPFGKDLTEFLIKPDGVTDRNWQGDSEGVLVTYRSTAGSVKYIWPIQQPLSDGGAQKKRLAQIRQHLAWQVIGCELVECYLD